MKDMYQQDACSNARRKSLQRPILIISIGIVLGIIWGLYFQNITFIFLFILVFVGAGLVPAHKKRCLKLIIKKKYILIFIIAFILSNLYYHARNNIYEKSYANIQKATTLVGKIISKAEEKEYTWQYILKLKRAKLYLYVDKGVKLEYGDIVKVEGEIRGLDTVRNYGGFDNKEYGKIKSNYGSISAKKVTVLKNEVSIGKIFFNIRNSIEEKICKALPKETSGILLAILIGEKSGITKENIVDFRDSSLIHMLCVSGAHVSYVATGLSMVISKVSHKKKLVEVCSILGLILFIGITGFSTSAYRAFIMGTLLLVSKILLKQPDTVNAISLSLIILLLINPFYLLDIGMLLSFGGTIGIVVFSKMGKKYTKNKIAEVLWVCFSAQIIIMPITLYFFNTLNLTFFLSNLAVSSLFVLIIFTGFITLFLSYLCMPLASIAGEILHLMIIVFQMIAAFFANLPFSNITVITLPIWLIVRILYSNYFNYKTFTLIQVFNSCHDNCT